MCNVKKEEVTYKVTQKVTHPDSISEMLHTVSILTDHIATSQLAIIKSQATGVYMIQKKSTKKNETCMEIGSKCATFYILCTHKLEIHRVSTIN